MNKSINIQELVDKFCKDYGVYPQGLIASVYKQGIIDLAAKVKNIMEEEETFEEIKEKSLEN